MPITWTEIDGPHSFWNIGESDLKLADLSTGYLTSRSCLSASSSGPSSMIDTSKGGLPPDAASFATWSVASWMVSVTSALVAFLNHGARILLCASFHVPGKVAATSVSAANAARGSMPAAPSPSPALSQSLRCHLFIMSLLQEKLLQSGKNLAGRTICGLDENPVADAEHPGVRRARFVDL